MELYFTAVKSGTKKLSIGNFTGMFLNLSMTLPIFCMLFSKGPSTFNVCIFHSIGLNRSDTVWNPCHLPIGGLLTKVPPTCLKYGIGLKSSSSMLIMIIAYDMSI